MTFSNDFRYPSASFATAWRPIIPRSKTSKTISPRFPRETPSRTCHVGRDVSLATLSSLYDVVVLAYGCGSDRGLEMPGIDLNGVLTARQFVNWYNGHPEFGYVADIVRESDKTNAVVVGNGNVALDCARILAKGREGLKETDVPSDVLKVLGDGVGKVVVAGRRGHVQGAFTIKVGRS